MYLYEDKMKQLENKELLNVIKLIYFAELHFLLYIGSKSHTLNYITIVLDLVQTHRIG